MNLKPIYVYTIFIFLFVILQWIICKIENHLFIKIAFSANQCRIQKNAEEYVLQAKFLFYSFSFLFYLIYIEIGISLNIVNTHRLFFMFMLFLGFIFILIERGNLKLINHLLTLKFELSTLNSELYEVTYLLGEIRIYKGDLYFFYHNTKDKFKIIL